MTTDTPDQHTTQAADPVDYLRYAAAEGHDLLTSAADQLGWLTGDHPGIDDAIERVQDMLDAVMHMLAESAAVFCRDGRDFDQYADGRPVRSSLELERGNTYGHIWHPQVDHRMNRPQELPTVTTTSGARKRILITAPGHVDAVDVSLRAIE